MSANRLLAGWEHKWHRFIDESSGQGFSCLHCDAYETVRMEAPACWVFTVHHDEWCPLWTYIRNQPQAPPH